MSVVDRIEVVKYFFFIYIEHPDLA